MADTARINALADAVASRPGPWTTRRASQLYRELGYAAPYRRTARRDLRVLTRRGDLELHETPGRTYYTRKEDTVAEYLYCGADLGRDEFPFTCYRHVNHDGECRPTPDPAAKQQEADRG